MKTPNDRQAKYLWIAEGILRDLGYPALSARVKNIADHSPAAVRHAERVKHLNEQKPETD